MNWKRFKNLSETEKRNEAHFILGIDLGNDSSALAYFDTNRNAPELIDVSGGYGKPSIPTVIQYIPESREWVFGEYAVLNQGFDTLTLSSLMDKLGTREYVEIDDKPVSIVHILSLYIKELIGNVKNLNPNAQITGIVAAVPAYMSEEAKEELLLAFKEAGYEKEVIGLAADRECVFGHYAWSRGLSPVSEAGTVLLLDYGSRQMRGGVYRIAPASGREPSADISLKSLSFLFEENLGTKKIYGDILSLFTKYYREETLSASIPFPIQEQLSVFAYQHKDLLFQKNSREKPPKLYFNFAYPPFQKSVSRQELEQFTAAYKKELHAFIMKILSRNLYHPEGAIAPGVVTAVLCTGGGFEMQWARAVMESMFSRSQTVFYKNAKSVAAEGACILAASRLGLLESLAFQIEDRQQVAVDLGLKVIKDKKEKFIPIVERNSFWWQSHRTKKFILNNEIGRDVKLDIFQRNALGDTELLQTLILDSLPERPPGVTRLGVEFSFHNYKELTATVTDLGFGELFPAQEYKKEFAVRL